MYLKVVILLFYFITTAYCQKCHVQGEAEGLLYIGHIAPSYNDCLNLCKDDSFFCSCFTYYEELANCIEFSECFSLDSTCTTCLSGEQDCTEYYQCDIDGLCSGEIIDVSLEGSEADCLALCQSHPRCEFYGYQGQDGTCVLLEDCSNINPCTDCHSGQRSCSISSQENLTILMVVGGQPYSANFDVELIDLTGQGRTCRKPDNFPGPEEGSVGAYVEQKTSVCGGYTYNHSHIYTSECYYYHPNGTWTQGPPMTEAREAASAAFFNNQWWISGGDNLGAYGLVSTELFNSSSNSFVPFVDLPKPRLSHNIVSIEDNRAMLLGGQSTYTETFIFDGFAWENGPSLSRGRWRSQAGLVTFNNGTRIIVAASGWFEPTTEFLIVGDEEWHFGPDFPYFIWSGASVQLENTFLIVGGSKDGSYLDTIWTFDLETEEWTILNEHLTTARELAAAFLVPDDFC